MAKIQTQESALDPILREREEWVRAAQVDTGALQDNVRRLQQSQSDLARSHEKTGVLSQEGLQRDPEAYNLAMQARDRLDDELSKAASAASTAEAAKKEAPARIVEIDRKLTAKERAETAKSTCVDIDGKVTALHGQRAETKNSIPRRRRRLADLVEQRARELKAAIANDDAAQVTGKSTSIGSALRDIDVAIEVATGSLAAAEDTIASIDGEITALGVQYEAAAREYHAAKYDAALLEAAIHDRADEPRRVELQVRSLRANRSPPGEKELDKEKVKDRMLETAGELPTLPRALFRPIVDETATPSLPDDVAEQVAA